MFDLVKIKPRRSRAVAANADSERFWLRASRSWSERRRPTPRSSTPDGISRHEGLYSNLELPLRKDDVFVFCTDGVYEALNERGEEFGARRVCDIVAQHGHLSARRIVDAIFQGVTDFRGTHTQDDDMTAVATKIRGLSTLVGSEVLLETRSPSPHGAVQLSGDNPDYFAASEDFPAASAPASLRSPCRNDPSSGTSVAVDVISAANGYLSVDYYVRDGGDGTCTLP